MLLVRLPAGRLLFPTMSDARASLLRFGSAAGLVLALGAAAVAFALPWLKDAPPGGPQLDRYLARSDGDSSLLITEDAAGNVLSWQSTNLFVISGERALAEAPSEIAGAIDDFYLGPDSDELSLDEVHDRVKEVELLEIRIRTLSPRGEVSASREYLIQDERGVFRVGTLDEQQESAVVFDPPALALPAALEGGSEWQSEGRFGTLEYATTNSVISSGDYETAAGRWEDCIRVESRLRLTQGLDPSQDVVTTGTYCAEVGLVETVQSGPSGEVATRAYSLSSDAFEPRVGRFPPSRAVAPPTLQPVASDLGGWELIAFGRASASGFSAESTIPPTWLPSSPEIVLAAGYGGDLVAFNVGDDPGAVEWRFRTAGTIYGTPRFDPGTGRIYFGSSDKHLYALDSRGFFLWSFETGDNVESRPLVVDDLVIFGSEDRNLYALDAATGELSWTLETNGAIASSPALASETAVVGSDDGRVYGVVPDSGRVLWQASTDGSVEAPIVAADSVAYAASRSGRLMAFDASSGSELWSVEVGSSMRAEPAVGETALYVVGTDGRARAIDARDGHVLWTSSEDIYAGPPLLLQDRLFLATTTGEVRALDPDSATLLRTWRSEAASETAFNLGPTEGGGVAWLGDDDSFVYRLGSLEGP